MSRAFPRERKKRDTNSEPRSEVTCSGTPCFENTCMMNIWARSLEVQWIVVGTNILCLVRRSTMTSMESQAEDIGSVSMKSIDMEFHGHSGIGSCLSKP